MGNLSLITLVVILANVLVSYKGFNDYSFFEKYKFRVGDIKRGEYVRLFSSAFLHVDWNHLLFNMVSLYFFANAIIFRLGTLGFIIVYLASLVAGSLLSYVFQKNNYNYSAVGASGAVMGIIYGAILFDPWMKINFIIPGFVFGIGYLLYSIYGMKQRADNIGHDAHFGGAIGGYVSTLILAPRLLDTDPIMVGVLAAPIVLLYALKKSGRL